MKPLQLRQARAIASHAPAAQPRRLSNPGRVKKRKGVWRRFADGLEDLFEEIENIFD